MTCIKGYFKDAQLLLFEYVPWLPSNLKKKVIELLIHLLIRDCTVMIQCNTSDFK